MGTTGNIAHLGPTILSAEDEIHRFGVATIPFTKGSGAKHDAHELKRIQRIVEELRARIGRPVSAFQQKPEIDPEALRKPYWVVTDQLLFGADQGIEHNLRV